MSPRLLDAREGVAFMRCRMYVTTAAWMCALGALSCTAFGGELEEQVGKFVAAKEKSLNSAHERMLKAIKSVQNDIRRSQLDPDAKKLALDRVRRDYEHCETTKQLPRCEELLGVAIQCADDRQKILSEIEAKRKLLLDKSIKTEDPAAGEKLDELESRVSALLGGRADFQQGSDWNGRRVAPDGDALALKLHVSEVSGGLFRGELHQTGSNRVTDIMKVEGTRNGNAFAMRTLGMVRGRNRSLEFHGYVVGPRIIARLNGRKLDGKPAVGWISLSKK